MYILGGNVFGPQVVRDQREIGLSVHRAVKLLLLGYGRSSGFGLKLSGVKLFVEQVVKSLDCRGLGLGNHWKRLGSESGERLMQGKKDLKCISLKRRNKIAMTRVLNILKIIWENFDHVQTRIHNKLFIVKKNIYNCHFNPCCHLAYDSIID